MGGERMSQHMRIDLTHKRAGFSQQFKSALYGVSGNPFTLLA